jgi:hypothetical protein
MIKGTYTILKKQTVEKLASQAMDTHDFYRFYCDIKPISKTVVPRRVRISLSTVLYKTNICMKLFNIASPKFNERGGTNCDACVSFT